MPTRRGLSVALLAVAVAAPFGCRRHHVTTDPEVTGTASSASSRSTEPSRPGSPYAPSADSSRPSEGLDGSWEQVAQEAEGEKLPIPPVPVVMKFAGNTVTVTAGARVIGEGTAKIDASRTPKTIDLSMKSLIGAHAGQTTDMFGIYEITGNTLRIYNSQSRELRPTAFPTGRDWKGFLTTFKRV
jgi:uncharacterized protein (TIGR03067 family)